ncbi:MAG: DNA mismatch repair protein MutS [Planctomycetota bacterium]
MSTQGLTPAMRQYVEQKKRVGDAVLLFRMGDFYESFWDDAKLCARVLGITLTARNKDKDPIPLAGIPFHALDGYLKKLVDAGYKVAISEQLEDPRHAKGVVKRDVVRIVTAGTLTDESLLDEGSVNILAAVCIRDDYAGMACVELAGGRFEVIDCPTEDLLDELVRARPAELLIDDQRDPRCEQLLDTMRQLCGTTGSRHAAHEFSSYQAEQTLLNHFGVSTLSGFGFEQVTPALAAAGAVISYLAETQKTTLDHIVSLRRRNTADHLLIDHNSWCALEIEFTIRGGSREGSLLAAIDRAIHPLGRRRMRQWLRRPLVDQRQIGARQDGVQLLVQDESTRAGLRDALREMADVERIAARVALNRASPRDLAGLARSLKAMPRIADPLKDSGVEILAGEGGYIGDGFDDELDRLRGLRKDANTWLSAYQVREMERTGIANLKVGFNRVFGYYIEIPHSGKDKVPNDFVRRQTLKNAERYITDELKQHETEVLTAEDRANERELALFEDVIAQTKTRVPDLLEAADAIGRIDALGGLAEIAVQQRFVRPEISDETCLVIEDGRHPVLDQVLGDGFVSNDTKISRADGRVFVITGPNMAGKSTYIRQVALLTLMAQMGSFVPAARMRFSLADRIFARIGASDEIMRGQSTFMVEMTEAANILHNATARSLVVLDEIGRGTSTFDGLALAWAITEHLANRIQSRCLIATHYHEMTELSELLEGVRNFNVAVKEYPAAPDREEGVVFLHRIVPGAANKSYGIHVARLAGLPMPVVTRSREVLKELEDNFAREARSPGLTKGKTRNDSQLSLFAPPVDDLSSELRNVDPQNITPMEALKLLADWKERFDS